MLHTIVCSAASGVAIPTLANWSRVRNGLAGLIWPTACGRTAFTISVFEPFVATTVSVLVISPGGLPAKFIVAFNTSLAPGWITHGSCGNSTVVQPHEGLTPAI